MQPYLHKQESISRRTAGRTEDILAAVAGRFIGAFPKLPPVYRTHSKLGFRRGSDCRYEMDLSEKFPHLLWDQQQFGAPGTNHQLTLIDSLDDCGSFGAMMLQAH